MKKLERLLAEKLLKISAIQLQPEMPFTWASGWNSPIYTDNRKTLSYPEVRTFIKTELCRLIMENFPEADAVAGVATGAIAQGALVADQMGLPYVYVRSTPKDHGLENLIEGTLKPGQKVIVIEDLISTGIRLMTLSNYEAMLDVALETGFIRDKDIKTLQQWREDPGNWTPANRNIE